MSAADPLRLAEEQAAELQALEDRVVAAALGTVPAELAALRRAVAGATAVSPDAWRGVVARLVAILDALPERARAAVERGAVDAYRLGLRQATGTPLLLTPPPVDAAGVVAAVLYQQQAVRLTVHSNDDVQAGLALADRAVTRVRMAAEHHVHQAAGQAVNDTARELGMVRRWVAERDACLHCLAYQGETAGPDAPFPMGLTFGKKPLRGVVAGTPLHPHCRCLTQLHDPADAAVLVSLKREARRSVAKGWSLPSESQPERLRAADRLLRAGAGLPQSVETEARRAVKRGQFRSRSVPSTR